MLRPRPLITLAIVALLLPIAPIAEATWYSRGSSEHDTTEDFVSYNFENPDNSTDPANQQIYFNAFQVAFRTTTPNVALAALGATTTIQTPVRSFHALLGVWKDCNDDGYIGHMENALFEYRSELLLSDSICKPKHDDPTSPGFVPAHNDGQWVREFIYIGPDCSVNEREDVEAGRLETSECVNDNPYNHVYETTRVWGDDGRPGEAPEIKCPTLFIPAGTLQSTGGVIRYGDCFFEQRVTNATNTIDGECDFLRTGIQLCFRDADPYSPEDSDSDLNQATAGDASDPSYGLIFDCDAPLAEVRDPLTGEIIYTVPTPSLDLSTEPSPLGIIASGAGALLDNCDPEAEKKYDVYTLAETRTPPPRQHKSSTDWDFVFYEGNHANPTPTDDDILRTIFGAGTPPDAGIGISRELGNGPAWYGLKTETGWNNPFIDFHDLSPNPAQYYTFYADVDPKEAGGHNHLLPSGSALSIYGGAACGHVGAGAPPQNGWTCDSEHWWEQRTLDNTYRASVGDVYTMRDIDCYDGSPAPVGPSTTFVTNSSCRRPPSALAGYASEVDTDRNGMGDMYESTYAILNGTLDQDEDGADAITEFTWLTHPVETDAAGTFIANAKDYDNDKWLDGAEITYWDLAADELARFALRVLTGFSFQDLDSQKTKDDSFINPAHDPDFDNDRLLDGIEATTTLQSYPEHQDSDCVATTQECTPPSVTYYGDRTRQGEPGTGDGLDDHAEYNYWKEVANGAWAHDWDRDGILWNLLDPDSDGDGIQDGDEYNANPQTSIASFDTDQDGLLDGDNITVFPNDHRYQLFEERGIVYQPLETGRNYIGERPLGNDPTRYDTDADGVSDGDEAGGVRPLQVRYYEDEVEDVTPTNEDLDNYHPQVQQWLENNTREVIEEVLPSGVDAVAGLSESPVKAFYDTLNATVDTLEDSVAESMTVVNETVEQLTGCLPEDSADVLTLDGVAAVECIIDTVEAVLPPPLTPIATEAIGMLEEHARDPLQPLDDLVADYLPFVEPLLDQVNLTRIQKDPTDLGAMPTPPNPFNPGAVKDTPLEDVLWEGTPFPQLLSTMTGDLLNGALFRTISNLDENEPLNRELIGTLDSGFYNILYTSASGDVQVATNWPLGSARPVHLADPNNTELAGADFVVKADFNTGPDLTQDPHIVVQKLTTASTPVLLAVFMQLPDTDLVVALGNDARTEVIGREATFPSELELSIGTNALQRSLAADPASHFHVSSSSMLPTNLVASYFKVIETTNPKQLVPDERIDLSMRLPATPTSLDVGLRENATLGGGKLTWSSTGGTSVQLAASTQHASTSSQLVVNATNLGLQTTLLLENGNGAANFTYTSGRTVDLIQMTWEGSSPTSHFAGGFQSRTIPTQIILRYSAPANTASFTSSAPLGETVLFSASAADTSTPLSCTKPKDVDAYAIHRQRDDHVCTSLAMEGLKSMTAHWGDNLTLELLRTQHAEEGILLSLEGANDAYLHLSEWPSSINIHSTRTASSWMANSTLSQNITSVNLRHMGSNEDTTLVVDQFPAVIDIAADYATGMVQIEATTSTPILDFSLRRSPTDSTIGLGDNDGLILVGELLALNELAVRLREFSSAQLRVDTLSGLSLSTDSKSPARFVIRTDEGDRWISADLPRLPQRVALDYTVSDALTTLHYTSSEKIDHLHGSVEIAGERATLSFELIDFPNSISVEANLTLGRIDVNTSTPVERFEIALAGADRQVQNVTWDNYLMFDQVATIQTETGSMPQFHVKINKFDRFYASASDGFLNVTTRFNGTPGDFAATYRGTGGWLYANVTTDLPPTLAFQANRTGTRWMTTPGYTLSAQGSAQFDGFSGRWIIDDIPDSLEVEWTQAQNSFTANLAHTGESVDRLFLEAKVNLTERAPQSLIGFDIQDMPARVTARYDAPTGRTSLFLNNTDGESTKASLIKAIYVADAAEGIPSIAGLTGNVAYARFSPQAVDEVFLRFHDLKTFQVSTLPDPQRDGRRWIDYHAGMAHPTHIDIQYNVIQGLRGTILDLPADLSASLLLVDRTSFILDANASSPITSWDLAWSVGGDVVQMGGSLPHTLHAEHVARRTRFTASEPTNLEFIYGPTIGTTVAMAVPNSFVGDYVFARAPTGGLEFGIRVTGLELVDIRPDEGRYQIHRTSSNNVLVEYYPGEDFSIGGQLTQLAPHVTLTLDPENVNELAWSASASTGGVSLTAFKGSQAWRLIADGVPTEWRTELDPALQSATIEVLVPAESFGSLSVGFSQGQDRRVPVLVNQGFVANFTPDGESPSVKAAARVDGLVNLYANLTPLGVAVHVERSSSSGALEVRYRTTAYNIDLVSAKFPTAVDIKASRTDNGGLEVDIDGNQDAWGTTRVHYRGSGGEAVAVRLANLPSRLLLSLQGSPESDFETLVRTSGGGVPTSAFGMFRTSNGFAARFYLTELPQSFSLTRSTQPERFVLETTAGKLTGELFAAPSAARVAKPITGYGVSVATAGDNMHAWLRVHELTRFEYRAGADNRSHQQVEVTHASAPPAPLGAYYESGDTKGFISFSEPAASMHLNTWNEDGYKGASYTSSGEGNGSVWIRAAKQTGRAGGYVRIDNMPTSLSVGFQNDTADWLRADLTRAPGTAPDVSFGFRQEGAYVNGILEGLPESTTLQISGTRMLPGDTQESLQRQPCAFIFETSSSFTSIDVRMGKGEPRNDDWARRGRGQWVAIDLSNPVEPALDLYLRSAGDAHYCDTIRPSHDTTTGEELESRNTTAEVNIGYAKNLRVHYKRAEGEGVVAYIRAEAKDVPGGRFNYTISDSGLTFQGPGTVPFLEVQGMLPIEQKVFGRTIRTFKATAHSIPGSLSVGLGKAGVLLDSADGTVGRLDLTLNLNAPASSAGTDNSASAGATPPRFTFDGDAFRANRVIIKMSDGGRVTMPSETHKLVFDNTNGIQLGLDMTAFRGGRVEVNGGRVNVDDLALSAAPLRADLRLNDIAFGMPLFMVARVDTMSSKLDLDIVGDGLRIVDSTITPGSYLDRITMTVGPDHLHGWVAEVRGVPADVEVGMATISGAALSYSLGVEAGAEIGGWTVGYYADSTHYAALVVGRTRGIDIAADLDGSTAHPGNPRVFFLSTPDGNNVNLEARWGENAVQFGGDEATAITAYVLITLTAGASTAAEAFGRVGEFTSEHVTQPVMRFVKNGVTFSPPITFWSPL